MLGTLISEWMASLLAVPANEGMRSARLGGTDSLGHRRAPGACRPVGNGWVGHIAIAGRRPRSGASRRRASLSRPCASQQGWPRSVVWVSSQRKLAEHRGAVPQLRQVSLAGGSACAVEALPSSQTALHAAPAQGRAGVGIRFTGRTPTARDRLPLAAQQLAVFSEVHQRVLGV